MQRRSSVRIIWETAINFCPRFTDWTNGSAPAASVVLSNSNFGFMVALEPRYNHVLSPTFFLWIKLTDDGALPSDVAASRFLRISVGTRRLCSPNAKSIYKP